MERPGWYWCSLKSTGTAPESELWETVGMAKKPFPETGTPGELFDADIF
jgi:hypothetical protein